MLWAIFLLLTHSAGAVSCQPANSIPNAQLYQCESLNVIYLQGRPEARARAMGELVRSGALSSEPLTYFSTKFRQMAEHQAPGFGAIAEIVFNQVVRLLHRETPANYSRELDALAGAMGWDPIDLRRSLSTGDVAALMNVLSSMPLFRAMPPSGCTSVATRSANGELLYGRNLDFAGTGVWDQHPMITVSFPEDKNELKRISFAADGSFFGGITGVNEAGIGFAVHQNYTNEGGLRGVPMVFLGEMVLRSAHTLEEAIEILRAHRPAIMWTFVITSFTTGEAVAIETSPTRFSVRHMESNTFIQTNHVMNEESRPAEYIGLGIKMNSIFRMKKAYELLDEKGRSLDSIAAILAYQEDPEGRISAYHDILKAHTIQTVLLAPERAWVSLDAAPTSGGRMASFSLGKLWTGEPPEFEIMDLSHTPPKRREHQRQIAEAFRAYFDRFDPAGAAALLSSHDNFGGTFFQAVSLMNRREWQAALLAADQALLNPRFLSEPAYLRQSLTWIKAAALGELGRKNEAASVAESLLAENPENKRLRESAELLRQGKNLPRPLRTFIFDFFSGDLYGRAN